MHEYPNETLLKFGYPKTLVKEYSHWAILVRLQQVSLGSLVLVSKDDSTSFSGIPQDAFTELHQVVSDIERNLKKKFEYDKINYLMLMMIDPHVHYHVIPRYSTPRNFLAHDISDNGWPAQADLSHFIELTDIELETLILVLHEDW